MSKRLLNFLKISVAIGFAAYLVSGSAIKAQRNAGEIRITNQAGESVILYEQSHALIIWVSKYQHSSWSSLEAVPKGARLLEEALRQRGFNVVVAANPTSQKLRDVVNNFIGEHGYDKNNRLVIFFAGHGWTIDKTDGYIVPADTPDPIIDEQGFFRQAISMEDVMAWAKRIKTNHALFLFDSCFSGTLFETKSRPDHNDAYIRTVMAKPVRQFLTAGDAGEEVPAGNDFVRLFIQGLDGEADFNKDGYVTGLEIGAFVQLNLPSLTENAQSPQYGKIRSVRLRQGDIVFRSLTQPNTPLPLPPEERRPKPSPPTPQSPPGTTLISKATRVDYSPLHDLLEAGKWKEADAETKRAMLQAASQENRGWLKKEDFDKFPCEDLRIIDQLWLDSSERKFGFSVQKVIYQQVDSSEEFRPKKEIWERYGRKVGWIYSSIGGGWLNYSDLWKNYSDLTYYKTALRGQLPIGVVGAEGRWGSRDERLGSAYLDFAELVMRRTTACEL